MMDINKIKDAETAERMWPELFTEGDHTVIELTNGEVLCNRFGKYQPNLCFILNEETCSQGWEPCPKSFNIDWDGDPDTLRGEYWVSKKGTDCFRPRKDGPHLLVRVNWGGCFIETRGEEFDTVSEMALYSRRAPSNGGGTGYNFYVFEADFHREVSIEDI